MTVSSPSVLGAVECINDCDTHAELLEVREALDARLTQLNLPVRPTPPVKTPLTRTPRDFRIGDKVEFTMSRGRQTGTVVSGKVIRVNRRTCSVRPDSHHHGAGGGARVYTTASYYRVPPRMLRKI